MTKDASIFLGVMILVTAAILAVEYLEVVQ